MFRDVLGRKDVRKALVIKGISADMHHKIMALSAYQQVPMYRVVERLLEIALETERVRRALRALEDREPL